MRLMATMKVSRMHHMLVAKGRNQWQKALIASSTVKSAVKTILHLFWARVRWEMCIHLYRCAPRPTRY